MKAIDTEIRNRYLLAGALVLAVTVVYYFSNPKPGSYYDYTFRVAGRMLQGHISLAEQPPPWLNEFVPFEGGWYSVFPLGAVVTMLPIAALKAVGLMSDMPAAAIYSLLAGACCLFLLGIASRYDIPRQRQILLTLSILFGTFTWTNLVFGGAWQLALGLAMLGELGAIWFTVYDRRPFIAGIFFALAFGNRTENLLTAPIFFYLLSREDKASLDGGRVFNETEAQNRSIESKKSFPLRLRVSAVYIRTLVAFCAVPFVLGIATLAYNYTRFHSFTDFGYERIPGVLNEPWYNHGIFSVDYIRPSFRVSRVRKSK